MFKNAIVRTPGRSLVEGITSQPELGQPNYELALEQHKEYIKTLESLGCEVLVLEPLEDWPDSTFVEDPAVLTKEVAIIARPGTEKRMGEKDHIVDAVKKYYPEDKIKFIEAPGTLDGGDVMMVGDYFYVGLSDRTNQEGADQFINILKDHGLDGEVVELKEMLHLKTGVNYLENNNLLVAGEFVDNPLFEKFNQYEIPEGEEYAANSLWVNGTVIVPEGFPKVLKMIQDMGYETVTVDTSEFRKLDGGLSCLSLRFKSLL